jgi:hypothetical protein
MKKIIIALAIALTLTACDQQPQTYAQQQYAPNGQPVAVGQPPQVVVVQQPQHNSNDGLVTGMALGYLMSGGSSRQNTTVIERHTTVVQQPQVVQQNRSAPSKPTPPAVSFKPVERPVVRAPAPTTNYKPSTSPSVSRPSTSSSFRSSSRR